MTNTILVTGASSGIGKATATVFAERGWNVVATMRSVDGQSAAGRGEATLLTRLDVTDPASIDAAVSAGLERFGQIDVVVNNAGYALLGPLEAVSMEQVRRQFETNVFGLLSVTKAVLPHFRTRRAGTIINVSSIVGRLTFPLGALYDGTKFAVEGISEALSYELADIGVRMKIVEPGLVATNFGRAMEFVNDPAISEYQHLVEAMGRASQEFAALAGPPETVAEVIFRAATDGTDTLRYPAGEDAERMIALRRSLDDHALLAHIRGQFGIASGASERAPDRLENAGDER